MSEVRRVRIGTTPDGYAAYARIRYSSEEEKIKKTNEKIKQFRSNPRNVPIDKRTFADWAKLWYASQEKEKAVSPHTAYCIKRYLYIVQFGFPNVPLESICLSDFDEFLQKILYVQFYINLNLETVEIIQKDTPCSRSYMKKIVIYAHTVWKYAIVNGSKAVDFFEYVHMPVDATKTTRDALSENTQFQVLNVEHKMKTFALISMLAGLRRSEALALQWKDIDFEHNFISITKHLDLDQEKILPGGKTINAIRNVPLCYYLKDYLLSIKGEDEDYVILSSTGKIYTKSAYNKAWKSYIKCFNETFTSHCLRHTYATILFLQNVPEIEAMQYLGHASIQTTVNIYTDLKNFNKYSLSKEYQELLNNDFRIIK